MSEIGKGDRLDEGHTQESACLNCGAALVGSYCHRCGQGAHVHRTLSAFVHDLLHGVLHFEGKIWRTLPQLVWRPGRLTREYIDGRRASYISPIALFLFVVFVSYATFSALGGAHALGESVTIDAGAPVEDAYRTAGTDIARLQQDLRAQDIDAVQRAELERQLAGRRRDREALGNLLGLAEADAVDAQAGSADAQSTEAKVRSLWQKARANPQLLIYKLQTNAYKFSWFLIPISVPFVALLFAWRRGFRMYDHTVFVTYSIAFMIALVGVASAIVYLGGGDTGWLLLLYAPVHLYRHLRGTYALGRFGALWRMLVLSGFAWLAIALFALVLVLLASG